MADDSSAQKVDLSLVTEIVSGYVTHGFAARNYALAQVMLQAGLRVGEVAALRVADITLSDRSGNVRIRHGKGLKAREVPLNATARRALKRYLAARPASAKEAALFVSGRETAMPVRSIQAVITSLARRAQLKRVPVSAHTLRHTFALGYLRDNPGNLLELAGLLGHESARHDRGLHATIPRGSRGRPGALASECRRMMTCRGRLGSGAAACRRLIPARTSSPGIGL